MTSAYLVLLASLFSAPWLEARKLVGAEVMVSTALAMVVSRSVEYSPMLAMPWTVFTSLVILYFSSWKSGEPDLPHPWLMME